MSSFEVHLPPKGLFLRDLLVTAISYLSWYADGMLIRKADDHLEVQVPGDMYLKRALCHLVEDLVNNKYGLQPMLTGNDKASMKRVITKVLKLKLRQMDVNQVLRIYVDYCNGLDNYCDELNKALSLFNSSQGYTTDIGSIPLLSILQPEFMEAFRMMGGWRGSSKFLVRNLRVGFHATMLGLIGVHLTKCFVDRRRGIALYVIPHEDFLVSYRYLYANFLLGHRFLINSLKARGWPSSVALLLYLVLRSISIGVIVATTLESGRRVDMISQDKLISVPARLTMFATILWSKSDLTPKKIVRLLEHIDQGKYQHVACRFAQVLFEAVSMIDIDPSRAISSIYDIARETYLTMDKERLCELEIGSYDIENIVYSLRTLSIMLRHGVILI